jgi:hypothetical protein
MNYLLGLGLENHRSERQESPNSRIRIANTIQKVQQLISQPLTAIETFKNIIPVYFRSNRTYEVSA